MIFQFNKTIKNNIISRYILHETVAFHDRDPPWINKNVKKVILEKDEMYRNYAKQNNDPRIFAKVKCLQKELNSIIESNKQKYYPCLSKKLVNSMKARNPIGQL